MILYIKREKIILIIDSIFLNRSKTVWKQNLYQNISCFEHFWLVNREKTQNLRRNEEKKRSEGRCCMREFWVFKRERVIWGSKAWLSCLKHENWQVWSRRRPGTLLVTLRMGCSMVGSIYDICSGQLTSRGKRCDLRIPGIELQQWTRAVHW